MLSELLTNLRLHRPSQYTNYYDMFVKNAFGNFFDILKEASFSPLMGEHLSYLRSKSHSYVYHEEDKRISRADENYVRVTFSSLVRY